MRNPISKMNMFATPKSIEALCDQIEQLTGSEKTVAYTYAIMMMNVCSQMVQDELAQEQVTA
jgi:hypothetical protein